MRRAIARAAANIARVAFRQIPKHWDLAVAPGVVVEQRVEPLARVGCYVPGGRFPLPSSLLMTAVPARVAGVSEIVAVCPRPEPAVMAAALEAGVTRLFRVGGAHAVAALAYGTATVPRVDKIVGPGNRYVAAAKAYVAADYGHRLLRRADRDRDRRRRRTRVVDRRGPGRAGRARPRRAIDLHHVEPPVRRARRGGRRRARARGRDMVERSLAAHGAAIVARSADEAMALANRIAPEHLVVDREALTHRPLDAGAVFVGAFTRAGGRRLRDRIEPRAADRRAPRGSAAA